MTGHNKTYDIPAFECPADFILTARSYLIDRFVPDCERIQMPAKTVEGGTFSWHVGPVTHAAKPASRLNRLMKRSGQIISHPEDRVLFDFRFRAPDNWAHFLNNHLPAFFFLAEQEGLAYESCTLILPQDIPNYIVAAANLFGVTVLSTDAAVKGYGLTLTPDPWKAGRAIRGQWVSQSRARAYLAKAEGNAPVSDLPKRVFLSRKDSRTLENESDVEALLATKGYTKVYAEDLSVLDQFSLFQRSERIVAVHGAGLAPLLYCTPDARPQFLVELFPCGHMTDVYRVMSHQIGCRWAGVRGKIKPEHIEPAYRLGNAFVKFSLQSFEIDLKTLEHVCNELEMTQKC